MIAGNSYDGIYITGAGSDNNYIRRNWIGLNVDTETKLPNGGHGVHISDYAQWNTVGGGNTGYENKIFAGGGSGINVNGAHHTTIQHNMIGIYSAHPAADGITIVGGSFATNIFDNTISFPGHYGIWISGAGTTASVLRNSIEFSGYHGLAIYDGARVLAAIGNSVTFSGWTGIAIYNSNGNKLQDNEIGVDRHWPDTLMGNRYYGAAVTGGSDNVIGPGNLIAHNGQPTGSDGVLIDGAGALRNQITRNSIYDNAGKGIRNINGGNDTVLLALTQANCQAVKGLAVHGTVEIFSDSSDEGRFYEGSTPSLLFGTYFSWTGSFRGPKVTITVTDDAGNTSEFSPPLAGRCFKLFLPLVKR